MPNVRNSTNKLNKRSVSRAQQQTDAKRRDELRRQQEGKRRQEEAIRKREESKRRQEEARRKQEESRKQNKTRRQETTKQNQAKNPFESIGFYSNDNTGLDSANKALTGRTQNKTSSSLNKPSNDTKSILGNSKVQNAKEEYLKPFEDAYNKAKSDKAKADSDASGSRSGDMYGWDTLAAQKFEEARQGKQGSKVMGILSKQVENVKTGAEKTKIASEKSAQAAQTKDAKDNAEKTFDAAALQMDVDNDPKRDEYIKKGLEGKSKLKDITNKSYGHGLLDIGLGKGDELTAYLAMSDDEKGTYFALNGKYGEETANKYLDSIRPDLENRAANAIHESIENTDNELSKKALRLGNTFVGAGENVKRNVYNLPASLSGSDDVIAPGTFQKSSALNRENMEGVEKVVNDITDSGVNMLPSIAVSTIPGVGAAASAAMTGATSYSGNYSDAILSGYEPGQAAAYAAPAAISEAGMQYAIGGIAKMGGSRSLTNAVRNAMGKVVTNPTAQNVLGKVSQAGGEALEEYLQANLEPALRNLVLGEQNDLNPLSEDKAYAALLGAIMGGGVDVATDVTSRIANRANNVLARNNIQRSFNSNDSVRLNDGTEAVVAAREGDNYIVTDSNGPKTVTSSDIVERVQTASPTADKYIAPETRAQLNSKYDARRVDKAVNQNFVDSLSQNVKSVVEPVTETFYDRAADTVRISPDSTRADAISVIARTEIARAVESNPDYAVYQDYALNRLFNGDTAALSQAIEAKQDQYIANGINLSDADATAEIVADYTNNIYGNDTEVAALVESNPNMARAILDLVKNTSRSIRASVRGDVSALANIPEYQNLTRAQSVIERALANPAGTQEALESTQATEETQDIAEGAENTTESVEEAVADIMLENPDQQQLTLKERFKNLMSFVDRKLIDSGSDIGDLGKLTGNENIYSYYNDVRHARGMGSIMIGGRWLDSRQHGAQYDFNMNKVGRSLDDIFTPIRENGEAYTKDFFAYLLHEHNVNRMAQEKPVFGKSVTAEVSRAEADALLEAHPEFHEMAKEVWKYSDNLLQYRVDAGIISQEEADIMREMYPHYVPTFRKQATTRGGSNRDGRVRINTGIKGATGSDLDILPIDEMLARQTMQVTSAASMNVFGNELLNAAFSGIDGVGRYISSVEASGEAFDIDAEPAQLANNKFTVYKNGVPYTLTVSDAMFEGISAFAPKPAEDNPIVKAFAAYNNFFKGAVTSWNPLFLLTNSVKDVQDGALNSKNAKRMLARYPKAFAEIAGNGEIFQKYMAAGGVDSSFFDNASNFNRKRNKLREYTIDKFEFANLVIEQSPRLAEFMSVYEAGISEGISEREAIAKAIYAADDITTNFGRSGTWGKMINKFVPFFNAGTQGASKMVRTLFSSKSGKAWANLAIKTAMLGVIPVILNNALYWDDEEYQHLDQYVRDNNYLFKLPNGKFLRIPKGRVLSIFASATDRAIQASRGKENAFEGYFNNVINQVAPANPLTDNIFSSFIGISNNRAWHGGEIENQQMQSIADPTMRYDETTSEIGKAIGKAFGVSPVMVDYFIDQQTGFIGDIILPLFTPAAERNPVEAKFITDPALSADYNDNFYRIGNEIEKTVQAEQRGVPEDERIATPSTLAQKYLNTVSGQVSELYTQIDALQADEYLDDDTKLEEVRKLRTKINDLQNEAVESFPEIQAAIEKYYNISEDSALSESELIAKYNIDPESEDIGKEIKSAQKKAAITAYAKAMNDVFDSASGMAAYGKDDYSKAQNVVSGGGITMDQYFEYFTGMRDVPDDDTAKKQALLDIATDDTGLAPMYASMFEASDTKERKTIAYAVSQGVRPSAFVTRSIQSKDEKGTPGESADDAIWEGGKVVVDENGTTESGSKKAQVCENLLSSGYTETEKAFFYQNQYNTDDTFSYYTAAGLPVDDYLMVKGFTAPLRADKDENGKSISGSKKAKLQAFIDSSSMSNEQKLFFFAQEYKISGSDAQTVRIYIEGLNTTDDVKAKLLESVQLGGGSGGSGRRGGGAKGPSKALIQKGEKLALKERLGSGVGTLPELDWSILNKSSSQDSSRATDTGVLPQYIQAIADVNAAIANRTKQTELDNVDLSPWLGTSQQKSNVRKAIQKRYEGQ